MIVNVSKQYFLKHDNLKTRLPIIERFGSLKNLVSGTAGSDSEWHQKHCSTNYHCLLCVFVSFLKIISVLQNKQKLRKIF